MYTYIYINKSIGIYTSHLTIFGYKTHWYPSHLIHKDNE